MDAVEFIKERERMCHYQHHTDGRYGCKDCSVQLYKSFNPLENCLIQCEQFESNSPKLFVSLVEKWSKEHPIVTNVNKFAEVFGCQPSRTWDEFAEWLYEEYKAPESEDK